MRVTSRLCRSAKVMMRVAGVAIVLSAALFLVAACTFPETTPQANVCPVPEYWSPQDQTALASSLAPLPPDSPIIRLALDWQEMRDKLRACRSNP